MNSNTFDVYTKTRPLPKWEQLVDYERRVARNALIWHTLALVASTGLIIVALLTPKSDHDPLVFTALLFLLHVAGYNIAALYVGSPTVVQDMTLEHFANRLAKIDEHCAVSDKTTVDRLYDLLGRRDRDITLSAYHMDAINKPI